MVVNCLLDVHRLYLGVGLHAAWENFGSYELMDIRTVFMFLVSQVAKLAF